MYGKPGTYYPAPDSTIDRLSEQVDAMWEAWRQHEARNEMSMLTQSVSKVSVRPVSAPPPSPTSFFPGGQAHAGADFLDEVYEPVWYQTRGGDTRMMGDTGPEGLWARGATGPSPEHDGFCFKCHRFQAQVPQVPQQFVAPMTEKMVSEEVAAFDRESSNVIGCRLPLGWRHPWSLEERQVLLILRFYSRARWSAITARVNAWFGYNLSEQAMRSQYDHLLNCLPMEVVDEVLRRGEEDPEVRAVLASLATEGAEEAEEAEEGKRVEVEMDIDEEMSEEGIKIKDEEMSEDGIKVEAVKDEDIEEELSLALRRWS